MPARQRINPDLQVPTTIPSTSGGIVDTFVRAPREPRVDTSLLQGLSTLSSSLANLLQQTAREDEEELRLFADQSAANIGQMSLEELEKALLSEEGKSIIAGLSPGRSRVYHEFAGKRWAQLKADELYDPTFQEELIDPNSSPDIFQQVDNRIQEILKFEEGHSPTFKRASLQEMGQVRNQLVNTLRQRRGARFIETNHQQAVAEMSSALEKYANDNGTNDFKTAELEIKAISKLHKNTTGEKEDVILIEGLNFNTTSELRNLTQFSDLDNLRKQVEFVRARLRALNAFSTHEPTLREIENQIDKAELRQEELQAGGTNNVDKQQRKELTDNINIWLTDVVGPDVANWKGRTTAEIQAELIQWLTDNDKGSLAERAKSEFVLIKSIADSVVRGEPDDPNIKKQQSKAESEFQFSLWQNKFASQEDAMDAATALWLEHEMSSTSVNRMIQDIRIWQANNEELQRKSSQLIVGRGSEAIRVGINTLKDALAQAINGTNAQEYLEGLQPGDQEFRAWNERFGSAQDFVAATLSASIQSEAAKNIQAGAELQQAVEAIPPERIQELVNESVSEYQRIANFEEETTTIKQARLDRESREQLFGITEEKRVPNSFSILLRTQLPPDASFPIVKDALAVLNNEETEPSKKFEIWKDAESSYKTFAKQLSTDSPGDDFSIDSSTYRRGAGLIANFGKTRQGEMHVTYLGRPSKEFTSLYFGIRSMGIDPYSADELEGKLGPLKQENKAFRQDKHGIGLNLKELGSKALYNASQTLYARDEEHLIEITNSEEWKRFVKLHEKNIGTLEFPGAPKDEIESRKLLWFLQSQQALLNFYGKSENK